MLLDKSVPKSNSHAVIEVWNEESDRLVRVSCQLVSGVTISHNYYNERVDIHTGTDLHSSDCSPIPRRGS